MVIDLQEETKINISLWWGRWVLGGYHSQKRWLGTFKTSHILTQWFTVYNLHQFTVKTNVHATSTCHLPKEPKVHRWLQTNKTSTGWKALVLFHFIVNTERNKWSLLATIQQVSSAQIWVKSPETSSGMQTWAFQSSAMEEKNVPENVSGLTFHSTTSPFCQTLPPLCLDLQMSRHTFAPHSDLTPLHH